MSTARLNTAIVAGLTSAGRAKLTSYGLGVGGASTQGAPPRPRRRAAKVEGLSADLEAIDKDFNRTLNQALTQVIPAELVGPVTAWPTKTGASRAALDLTVDSQGQAVILIQPIPYLLSVPSLRVAWAKIEQASERAALKAAKLMETV